MTIKVKELKKNSSDATKELKKDFDNTLSKSKKIASDDELMQGLSDFNVDELAKKTETKQSIWKLEFKNKYNKDNHTSARRMIRNEQVSLSSSLISAILTKQNKDILKDKANQLKSFYVKGLINFSVYSSVSKKLSEQKRKVIDTGYVKMKQILSL